MSKDNKPSRGFTIVELMIATTVFSVFLLLLTLIIMQLTRTYTKGLIASKTQETARSISAEISRAIQFGGASVTTIAPPPTICAGTHRFSYILGRQVKQSPSTADHTQHALVADTVPAGCPPGNPSSFVASTQRELIPENMRLAKLSVTQVGSSRLYTVTVRVIYGDADLVDDLSTGPLDPSSPNASCVSEAGNQFCAVSELVTTVEKRL